MARATTNAVASEAALLAERARATELARRYGGRSELLTLAEASRRHPNLTITPADLADTSKFHIRFRPCTICGRFPARALDHLALHESGLLDANGHRTDAQGRAAIAARVAKMKETLGARPPGVVSEFAAPTRRQDWSERENVILVGAYLDLLAAELRGEPRVKREINRSLQTQLDGRSQGSIEFKMENVSAVLFEEGLPWVDGYKPASNFQKALRPIVLDALSDPKHGRAQLEAAQRAVPPVKPAGAPASDFEVKPPPAKPRRLGATPGSRVSRSWKGAVIDAANRRLGRAGEEWVCKLERERLIGNGRPDLAKRVEWVAETRGDGLGYDVLSFDKDGSELWIEVKTTNGGKSAPFLLTPNELAVWRKDVMRYRLFRVHSFSADPRFYRLSGAPDQIVTLTAALWEARLA